MSIASEYSGFDWDNLLLPHDMWPSYFEEVFEASPDAAENMARVLYEILDPIQSGPDGVAKTINTLNNREGRRDLWIVQDIRRPRKYTEKMPIIA